MRILILDATGEPKKNVVGKCVNCKQPWPDESKEPPTLPTITLSSAHDQTATHPRAKRAARSGLSETKTDELETRVLDKAVGGLSVLFSWVYFMSHISNFPTRV